MGSLQDELLKTGMVDKKKYYTYKKRQYKWKKLKRKIDKWIVRTEKRIREWLQIYS